MVRLPSRLRSGRAQAASQRRASSSSWRPSIAAFFGFRALDRGRRPRGDLARRVHAPSSTAGKVATATIHDQDHTVTRRAHERHRVHGRASPRSTPTTLTQRRRRRRRRRVRHRPPEREPVGEPAVRPAAVRVARARADVGARPGAGRRQPGHGLRQVDGQALVEGPAEGHVRRRRRPRRSGRGARGDQGVPRVAGEVPGDGREDPEGRAALRSARHRQDAARQGGGRRGGRAVLLDQRLRLRRDVRRRRRVTRARPLRAGEGGGAGDRVRRRDRRRRSSPRRRRSAAGTTSASRRSTSCSSRWTASTRSRA